MHTTIVTFGLNGLTDAEYRASCDEAAPMFAEIPGLIAKLWLADERGGTYGGIYVWEHADHADAYERSDLFAALEADPHLAGISLRRFDVLTGPSAVTGAAAVAG